MGRVVCKFDRFAQCGPKLLTLNAPAIANAERLVYQLGLVVLGGMGERAASSRSSLPGSGWHLPRVDVTHLFGGRRIPLFALSRTPCSLAISRQQANRSALTVVAVKGRKAGRERSHVEKSHIWVRWFELFSVLADIFMYAKGIDHLHEWLIPD